MRKFLLIGGTMMLAVTLASCRLLAPLFSSSESEESSSSSTQMEDRMAEAIGVLLRSGVNSTDDITHELMTDSGSIVLLSGDAVRLDAYIDAHVRVTGMLHMPDTASGGVVLAVETIEAIDSGSAEPQVLEESSSSSEESSSSAEEAVEESSSSASSSESSSEEESSSSSSSHSSSSKSSSSKKSSSSSSSSSSDEESSSSFSPAPTPANATAMAKAKIGQEYFTQQYCTSHIGFCVAIHKNWYYQSFGANVSPYLWHVEIGDHEIDEAGQGVIMVNLVSGSLADDTTESVGYVRGESVVAMRQWTGGRHFEISGPAALKASVEFIAQSLEVYQSPTEQ